MELCELLPDAHSVSIFSDLFEFNPLTPKSDWHQISSYNITCQSHVKVMKIKEMITNERSF